MSEKFILSMSSTTSAILCVGIEIRKFTKFKKAITLNCWFMKIFGKSLMKVYLKTSGRMRVFNVYNNLQTNRNGNIF